MYESECKRHNVPANASFKERLWYSSGGAPLGGASVPSLSNQRFRKGECVSFRGLPVDESFEFLLLALDTSVSGVTHFDFSDMGLTDRHISILTNTFTRLYTVHALDISSNRGITDIGGNLLKLWLEHNCSLTPQTLRFQDTRISSAMAAGIRDALNIATEACKSSFSVADVCDTRAQVLPSGSDKRTGEELTKMFTSRAITLTLLLFGAAYRILAILTWDPPLRTLTWFALCMSLGWSGVSVETFVLAFTLAVWHKKFSHFPFQVETLKWGDYLAPLTVDASGEKRFNVFSTWRHVISSSVLVPLESGDDAAVEAALTSAFTLLECGLLAMCSNDHRPLRLTALVFLLAFMFLSPGFLFSLLTILLFLWTPVWSVLLDLVTQRFSVYYRRIFLSLAILRGAKPEPIDLASDPSHALPGASRGRAAMAIEVRLDALGDFDASFQGKRFTPQVAVSLGGSTWLSPTPDTYSEWSHPSGTTEFPFSDVPRRAIEASTLRFSLVCTNACPDSSVFCTLAQGIAVIDGVLLDHLSTATAREKGIGLKVKLQPVQNTPSLIGGLLESIFAHEDAERKRFNVQLLGIADFDLVNDDSHDDRAAKPPTDAILYLRLRLVNVSQKTRGH